MFEWVDFKLFGMEINQYNAVGILLAFLTTIYQIIAYFCLTNLTKEPGYQIFLKIQGQTDQIAAKSEEPNEKLLSFKDIVLDYDLVSILIAVFVGAFTCYLANVLVNITAVTLFEWKMNYLACVTVSAVFLSVISMRLLSRLHSVIDVNFLFVMLLITYSILMNMFSIPHAYKMKNRTSEVAFLMVCIVMYVVPGYNIRVWSNSLLFIIVPMNSRCFIVGVFQVTMKLVYGIGYSLAASFYQYAWLFIVSSRCCVDFNCG